MRAAGKLASELLNYLAALVRPGISTLELDQEATSWTAERGARSGPSVTMATRAPYVPPLMKSYVMAYRVKGY